ncbi:hypothetical protein FS842_006426 [Serendipita sp. 407]|nr:hypothetical protein FS842_006426 [Serendipita sp. 407]
MASPPSRNVIKSRAHPEVGGKSSKTFHVEPTEIVSESSTTDLQRPVLYQYQVEVAEVAEDDQDEEDNG